MEIPNWDEMGVSWTHEIVSRGKGVDKRPIRGTAQIPTAADMTKCIAHFGEPTMLNAINGTSWRVMAQEVNRRMLTANPQISRDELRIASYHRINGVRTASAGRTRTVEVKTYAIPGGGTFTIDPARGAPENLISYQQMYLVALVDAGVPTNIGQNIIRSLTL